MQGQGIAVMAYDVLGGATGSAQNDIVAALAEKYKVTNAQLLIRWALDKGVVALVGAHSEEHILEDLNCSAPHMSARDTLYLESQERPEHWTEYTGDESVPH
mmetsp:Transcript_107725/g.202432  ORF Transcript_107725/g.202432 Transcript_107725/m.202432 type:complete len:102 (-) Transcript_107725:50-355(-)